MTLIELVVVVILIVIVALMLFPANSPGGRRRNVRGSMARVEITGLDSAIKQYEAAHGHPPASTNISTAQDFTFGTFGDVARTTVRNSIVYHTNNSEVIAILMARTHFPDGRPSPNVEHLRNPQKHQFITMKLVAATNSPGVGPDGVFRDPWENPYIITLDMNRDGHCRDAIYSRASVSEFNSGSVGHFSLIHSDSSPTNRNAFEAKPIAIVWSFGPDGKTDVTKKANEGVNKDNVLSWK